MKTTKMAILILAIAAALYILVPNLSWAEDAAAAYNANHLLSHHPTSSTSRLRQFVRATGSNAGVNALCHVEGGSPTGNGNKP
jgi:hypothetical protein